MHLDLPTLLVADSFVTTLVGTLLLVARLYNRAVRAAAWWGIACLFVAVATAILAIKNGLPDLASRAVVATLLNVASASYWAAARETRHAIVRPTAFLAGSVLWIAALAVPEFHQSAQLQMSLLWACGAAYSFSAAFEMWRGRDENLKARWPLFGLLFLDATLNAAGVVYGFFGEISAEVLPPLTNPFGVIYFEAFLLTVGGAFFIMALVFDRETVGLRTAANIDGLTGVARRDTFMADAANSLEKCLRARQPWSLVAFDLDHFKSVNDSHGHAVGDQVLRRFGEIVRGVLRERDLIGRIGGEEFAAVFPDTSPGVALAIGDRIRMAFAMACRYVGDRAVNATVSAGLASAEPGETVDDVLKAADEALYRAKSRGRNRIEREGRRDAAGPTNIVHVA